MKLKLPLYDFQAKGVEFAVSRRYSLNGDRPGLGKTAQALAVACEVKAKRILIVCPAFLVWNWKSEIGKFLGEQYVSNFVVTSYESLAKVDFSRPFDMFIADEVHYLKSPKAKRTLLFHTLVSKHRPAYFLGLSGTPIKNSVPEFFSLLKLCWYGGNYPQFTPYAHSSFKFNRDFSNEKKLRFGGRKFTKFEGVKNPQKLKSLVSPVYIRRKAEEVLTLPEQVRQEIRMSGSSASDELLQEAWEAYSGAKESKSFSSGKAVNALHKTSFTADFVKTLLPSQVVVFSDHVQSAKAIGESLGQDARVITGEIDTEERKEFVIKFNEGKIKTLICTIGSLSVGVNLTAASYMVFNDFPWVPADMDQAEARIHRIGQKSTCFYYYVLASDIDQMIFRTLAAKRKIISEVGT